VNAPAAMAIVASGVTKRFGHVKALRGVDLAVQPGEFLTLFGPNGAGKTTLLRILAGLTRPSGGGVTLGGQPLLADLSALRRRLGYVSHHTMLYDALSARENLMFVGRLHQVGQLRTRVDQLLRSMGLEGRADDPVGTLSRGNQQRVAVARALLHDPELILLDEPFSGLDQQAARVLRTLLATVRKRGHTVVLVTHDIARGLELADRAVIIHRGRVVHDGVAGEHAPERFEDVYCACVEERA
jgi:heme exporter protein A